MDPEVKRLIDTQAALNAAQAKQIAALVARVEQLERQAPAFVLGEIRDLLRPLSAHAGRILAVQAGALGVRQ